MAETKICGLSDAEGMDAALTGGARYVGFVFFPKSPRHLSVEKAASLATPARGRADTVAVTVDADDDLLGAIARTLQPDWIQLHGAETPARAAAVRRYAGKGVIRAFGVARAADLTAIDAYTEAADAFLFDAKAPPEAALPGGNGAAFDWRILAGRSFARPWFLSGGLDADNVAEAIATSAARMVDVSSGVERAPGVKDPLRIEAFLAAAKNA
ncbi:MAG: phosphoribosylanthranilate isomerase [Hyphomonadaceae bacterium]|nr:phosphoribosylanthranilate isomerase [Hyphomonadaceae bacterium]